MSLNSKSISALQKLARRQGMRMDQLSEHLYGTKNGFHIAIRTDRLEEQKTLFLCFSATTRTGPLNDELLKRTAAAYPALNGSAVRNQSIAFAVTANNPLKCVKNVDAAIEAAIQVLYSLGCVDCCQQCGTMTATATAVVNGTPIHLCQSCFSGKVANTPPSVPEPPKPENKLGGIIGAFIGSLMGVAAIVLFSQLGLVSALSGIVMAFGTMWVYEKMAGSMSKFGIVICVAVMMLMVYVGDRADWAIVAVRDLGLDFFTAFRVVPNMLQEGMIDTEIYTAGLGQIYLFALLGAVPMIASALQKRKTEAQKAELAQKPVYLRH